MSHALTDAVPSLTWATSTPLAPLQAALESRFQQTKALFTRLTSSAPSTSRQGSESEDLRARCHQLSAEVHLFILAQGCTGSGAHAQVASARAAVAALDAQLVNAKNDFEQQHARLLAAEKQFDRSQSKTVRDLDAKAEPVPQGPPKVEVAAEPSSAVKTEKPIEGTSTGLGSHAVPVDEGELADLRDQASRRQAEIEHLYSTRTTLTRAVDDLKTKVR